MSNDLDAYDSQIEHAKNEHHQSLRGLWSIARRIKNDETLEEDDKKELLGKLYRPLSTKDIKQFFVTDGNKFDIGVSFRSSVAQMMRTKSALVRHGYNIAPGGNSKLSDRKFGELLGVPVPRTLQSNVHVSDLTITPNSIVKPVSGASARGVFFIGADKSATAVKSGKSYSSFDQAYTELPTPQPQRWISEEAIVSEKGQLANDIKIYMFYGEPGICLEIDRDFSSDTRGHFCTYLADGEITQLGPKYEEFKGSGVPSDLFSKAKLISLATPVPFVRVDFHLSPGECVLGEITPHPGGTYAEELYDEIDFDMGKKFIDAEARLKIDLLEGKSFSSYFDVYGKV